MERTDDGFQALEVALLFPLVVLIALAAILAVRVQAASNEILGAARSAARAASIGAPDDALVRAQRAADQSITDGTSHCIDTPNVELRFGRRGSISTVLATVRCSVEVADLGFGVRRTVVASAEQTIDPLVSA